MTKHTPGPWRIGDAGAAIFGPKTDAPSPATIVSAMGKAGGDVSAMRANARLIAAAPDMLNALRDVAAISTGYDSEEIIGDIQAICARVIQQAQGEG